MNERPIFWPAIRSAIAACMIDGLTRSETALAVGRSVTEVNWHRWAMSNVLDCMGQDDLLIELESIA